MNLIHCTLCGNAALDVPANRLPHGVTSLYCLYLVEHPEAMEMPNGSYLPEDLAEWCKRREAELFRGEVEPKQMEMF